MHENIKYKFLEEEAIIEGIEFNEEYIIDSTFVKSNSILFTNVRFNRKISFSSLHMEGSITFKNCVFLGPIIFQEVNLFQINKKPEKENISISFQNCSRYSTSIDITIKNSKIEGIFSLYYCTNLQLNISQSILGGLHADHCHFNGHIELYNNNSIGNFFLNQTKVESLIECVDNKFDSIVFDDKCIISEKVLFSFNKITGIFLFNEALLQEDVKIESIEPLSDRAFLKVLDCKFSKDFDVLYWKQIEKEDHIFGFKRIIFSNNKFTGNVKVLGYKDTDGSTDYQADLNTLNLSNNCFDGNLQVLKFKNINLWIDGENLRGNMVFKNLEFLKFAINNYSNYGNLQFVHCHSNSNYPYSTLEICNSYFEKTNFTNCDLSSFKHYRIENSNLSHIKSSNTEWFHYDSLIHKKLKHNELTQLGLDVDATPKQFEKQEKEIKIRSFQEMRETFRQLKYAMESQGDRITALRFRRDEMKAYYSAVKERKNVSFNDKFILRVGWTNDHGQNWIRPLGLLFGFSFLFYSLIILVLGSPYGYIENLNIYFQMLIPTHLLDKVFSTLTLHDNTKLNLIYLIDFIHKVFLSFFIFQIISSFRKFVK